MYVIARRAAGAPPLARRATSGSMLLAASRNCSTAAVPLIGEDCPREIRRSGPGFPGEAPDGNCDRLVHNALRIEMRGASRRKGRGPKTSR